MDVKITIVGETEVGKTSLAEYFVNEQASMHTATTPCASFLKRSMLINDKHINFQLWDTAGQERFRSIAPMYYRASNYILIVCDVAYGQSFEEVKRFWLKEVRGKAPQASQIAIVCNKIDVGAKEVDLAEAKAFAEENKAYYFETSGKTGKGVVEMFRQIADNVLKGEFLYQYQNEQKVEIKPKAEQAGKGCCM